MRYLTYAPEEQLRFPVCILTTSINKSEIQKTYIDPFLIDPEHVLVLDLHQAEGKKKTPMTEMKSYIQEELAQTLNDCQVSYIVVTDSDYFKALTGEAKTEVHLGYVKPCKFGPWHVVYAPSFRQIFYDPAKIKAKIAQGMNALVAHRDGYYRDPGAHIINFSEYPDNLIQIKMWLEEILIADRDITMDIEAFSLKHNTAGIGTISFAWTKHEGIAFPVDLHEDRVEIRKALKSFFLRFKRKMIWHNIAYDVCVLIYQLFMDDILDTAGLLKGLDVMLANWHCTKLITYLATNSCAGNHLGLKDQAQEFAGNYAVEEIKDITKVPLPQLLEYNLVDSLSTWFVFEKHWDTLVADQQLDIYENLFQTATRDIIQMQLTGMPLNMERVAEIKLILEGDQNAALDVVTKSPIVQRFVYHLEEEHIRKRNNALKKKQIIIGDEPQEFNPNSGPQLQMLLYEMLQLPVLGTTDSGQPSTDGDTLKALLHHTGNQDVIDLLKAMIEYKGVNKILTSFIPAMEGAALGSDDWHYLFGNFNLGGTLSGRLSSSKPNLQNLPANSKYAKLIKSCFQAPPGWLFCGLDFDSLEDKISGLTTKDPQKLKVYTDGYDGHSLRAYSYFREQMPDILQSEGRRVFTVVQGGKTHYLFEGDPVTLANGKTGTIETILDELTGGGHC